MSQAEGNSTVSVGLRRVVLGVLFFLVSLASLAAIYSALVIILYTNYPPSSFLRELLLSESSEPQSEQDGSFWISELSKDTNYFLHIRHATREKFTDVDGFDVFEMENFSGRGETSFSSAICLNEEGLMQGELLRWAFNRAGLEVSKVWSSPSCRARQTAELAFGPIYEVHSAHLYKGAVSARELEPFFAAQRDFFDSFEVAQGGITVIVGHGLTPYYFEGVEVERLDGELSREEGGISVLSINKETRIITVHFTFARISDFILATP